MEKGYQPTVMLINGPNLNMLGRRDRDHYGAFTLQQVEHAFSAKAKTLGVRAVCFQSNGEGEIISAIQKAMDEVDGIVINAGAYTHYSYAIFDALSLCHLPVMEVHISNIHKREIFRHVSVISPACVEQIYGLGLDSYLVGLEKLVNEYIFPRLLEEGKIEKDQATVALKLSDLREKMGKVDTQLMKVFNERMELAEKVAHLKIAENLAVYDARREADVAEMARQRAGLDMGSRVDAMMKTMMRISREKQYDILMPADQKWEIGAKIKAAKSDVRAIKRVAFAGEQGSYSEAAAKALFPKSKLIPAHSFAKACRCVLDNEADACVLPLENTTAGVVDNVYELMQNEPLLIIKAVSLLIEHKLSVLPGTRIDQVRCVVSHPQGISQCSEFIRNKGWDVVLTDNTAYAPRDVADIKDKSRAAIASKASAEKYGLEILPVAICNSEINQTRFIAVSKSLIITPNADRISLLLHLPHRSGALVSALQVFSDRGLNLCSILSRPIPKTPWEYAFFLDFYCQAHGADALLALYQLSAEMPYLKVLGWYEEMTQMQNGIRGG